MKCIPEWCLCYLHYDMYHNNVLCTCIAFPYLFLIWTVRYFYIHLYLYTSGVYIYCYMHTIFISDFSEVTTQKWFHLQIIWLLVFLIPLQFNKLKKIRTDQENLPIFQYRQMILDKLQQNQIVVVAGDTGCGKSTQVGTTHRGHRVWEVHPGRHHTQGTQGVGSPPR